MEPLPLFLVTLTRKHKISKIFKLNSLKHIIIKVELYRAQTGLTHCYNCQNFGHVWANCKHSPRYLWCGGGHLHRECPEKTNTESVASCCNYTLVEGEKPRPASYRGCGHAKGELQRRRAQPAPKRSSGRTFFSKFTSPERSNAGALRQETQQHRPQVPQKYDESLRPSYSSICHNMKFREQVCQYRLPVRLTMTRLSRHCSAADHDRAQRSCVRKRQNNGHYKNGI
jgi:hypothetical protein